MQIKWYVWLSVVIGFLIALYHVEVGPWGAASVGKYNEGYGTFDMKRYAYEDVKHVLGKMQPEGFLQSYRYYICDSIFILFFGALQLMISITLYPKEQSSKIMTLCGGIAIALPILRGVFDMIENGLLCYTLKSYPTVKEIVINIASFAIRCKLMCIRIWGLFVVIGLIHACLAFILKGKNI